MESKYFKIYELVSRGFHQLKGEFAWWYIDPNLILTIDTLKEYFPNGSISINTWYWNGNRMWSGLREEGTKYYSKTSLHSFGKAVDCIFSAYSTEEVREFIVNNPDKFPHIKGIELGVSWLHIDTRNSKEVIKFQK
jgi:hypothetical protein